MALALTLGILLASIVLGRGPAWSEEQWSSPIRATAVLRQAENVDLHTQLDFLFQEFGAAEAFKNFLRMQRIVEWLEAPDDGRRDGVSSSVVGTAEEPSETVGLLAEGFEHIAEFSNDALQKRLSLLYGDLFVGKATIRIRYHPYRWTDRAADIREVGAGDLRINVFNDQGECRCEMSADHAVWLIQHELGHALDWRYNRALTVPERLHMLFEVTVRFHDPAHFRGYHESRQIVYDPDSAQNNTYQAVREFWADLAREYVRKPDRLRIEHPNDYELVHKWFLRSRERSALLARLR